MAPGAQRTQVGDVEGQPLITAVWNEVVNDRRHLDTALRFTQHAQRVRVEDLPAESVRPTPADIAVDIPAEAMPLLSVSLTV